MAASRSKLIWSFFWTLSERVSVQFVNFVVTILLARLLMPEEYGLIALISIFIVVANTIAIGGLNSALIQNKDADSVDFSTILYASMFMSVFLYVFLFFAAPYIARFYDSPQLIEIIRVLALTLPFFAFNSIQRAYVSKFLLFKKMFYCNLIASLGSGVIGLYMAWTGYGIWALVGQNLSVIMLSSVAMWFLIKWRPLFVFSTSRFKVLFDFGWKIFVSNLLTTFFTRIRALVIGKMYAPASLAYYDKGHSFPSLIADNVCGTIQSVLFPALSEVQDDKQKLKSMLRRVINTNCLFMFPLIIGLIVCAKPVVVLLLTEKWLPVVPFLQLLSLSYLFRPITLPNAQLVMAMGKSNITLILEVVRKVLDITVLIISCHYGVLAIAGGVVLVNMLSVFINLIPTGRLINYGLTEQIKGVLPALFISLLMGGSIYWVGLIQISPLLQLSLQFILGIFVFVSLSYIFKLESFIYLLDLIKSKL